MSASVRGHAASAAGETDGDGDDSSGGGPGPGSCTISWEYGDRGRRKGDIECGDIYKTIAGRFARTRRASRAGVECGMGHRHSREDTGHGKDQQRGPQQHSHKEEGHAGRFAVKAGKYFHQGSLNSRYAIQAEGD